MNRPATPRRTPPPTPAATRTADESAGAVVRAAPVVQRGAQRPANEAARLFRTLSHAFNRDAADHRVDALAADLAALVARSEAPLCLGLLRKEAVPRYYGLVFVLDAYGLVLRQRYRADGASAFVYVERKRAAASEFAGTVVRARRASPPATATPALPNAA